MSVDWKKIRDELYGFGFPEYQELQRFQENNFSNLISALEEQEKLLNQMQELTGLMYFPGGDGKPFIRSSRNSGIYLEKVASHYPELAAYLEEKNG